jgi:flagellin
MSLVINTNFASINAQRNLVGNTEGLNTSVQRLSSGLRINSAKDDAAGLSISEKLKAHTRSINVAVRNAQDGISMLQTAEGGLSEMGNILGRMRELAQQASNGTLGVDEITALNAEFTALAAEITRISDVSEFNGKKLLNGDLVTTPVELQVGFRNTANDRLAVTAIADSDATALGVAAGFADSATAQAMLDTVDAAIQTVSNTRGDIGAVMSRLDSTIANLRVSGENLTAAESRIRDADFAYETAEFTKRQILVSSATSVLAQANTLPQQALQLLR